MKYKKLPTQTRLKELFDYNPETGVFIRKMRRGNYMPGEVAGYKDKKGYLVIAVDGLAYQAHRLAWVWFYNEDPGEMLIDHKDTDRSNNSISNLRKATHSDNCANLKDKPKGVYYSKSKGKFEVSIKKDRKCIYIGTFVSEVEARLAYEDAAKQIHGEFAAV